ncbi:MAG: CaiB/BaiF CoA transferase family protein [Hyphomicrobiaceae bacterium]
MLPDKKEQTTALGHLRVLDLSRILAGPWTTQVLGDLGADVIKIEHANGDDTRQWGPPFVEETGNDERDAAYFTACNRNKKSIIVDFGKPEGSDLIRQMAEHCDIVIENFKVGTLAKYRLDYESLKAVNPKLIYCSISGFGQVGPYADRRGYDFLIQGMSGLMSITGQPDGQPGTDPTKVGVAAMDLTTGMYATVSILAALTHRDRTGQGQHIDCALFDSGVALLANQASNWLVGGVTPKRMGNNHPNIVPYRTYEVSDGHVIITCGNDDQFVRLCQALGLSHLASQKDYARNEDRMKNRDALDTLIGDAIAHMNRDQVLAIVQAAGVPCGPINTVQEVFADPNTKARGLEIEMTRDKGEVIRSVAFPARLSETPATYRRAPPKLGADTDDVLEQVLKLSPGQIAKLKEKKVIGQT